MFRLLICDDSQDYAQILSHKINAILSEMDIANSIEIINNLSDLKSAISNEKYDVLFLDIMVEEESSIDWCIQNIKHTNIPIVFMTAFPVEAYNISEMNHAYFLVKSRITAEMLRNALLKVMSMNYSKNTNLMILKVGSQNITINALDIVYIEGRKNNIYVNLINNECIKLYMTLQEFESKLSPNFLKIHRSYIIYMNFVKETTPYQFVLLTNNTISVNKRKFKEITTKYSNYINSI